MEENITKIENVKAQMQIEVRMPNKVIIHNLSKVDLSQIVQFVHTVLGVSPIFWCKGYLIILNSLQLNTDPIVEAYLKGEMHFSDVIYCPLETFSKTIRIEENKYQDYAVIDMSASPIYNSIAQLISVIEAQSKSKG